MPAPFVIKRKLQAAIGSGGDPDVNALAAIFGTPVSETSESFFDNLTVNNLVVKNTFKQPVGTDKYK